MTIDQGKTLRLLMAQWQGGNNAVYHFGAHLLAWLAPAAAGPVAEVDVAPPTFAVFGNHPDLVQEHYVRYLHNGFRESWGFRGNPVRILLRRKAA